MNREPATPLDFFISICNSLVSYLFPYLLEASPQVSTIGRGQRMIGSIAVLLQ